MVRWEADKNLGDDKIIGYIMTTYSMRFALWVCCAWTMNKSLVSLYLPDVD